MNVMVLLRATIPHPNSCTSKSLNDRQVHWLCTNLLFPTRVMLVLFTAASAVPRLPWKEQLTSLAFCVDCKNRAEFLAR